MSHASKIGCLSDSHARSPSGSYNATGGLAFTSNVGEVVTNKGIPSLSLPTKPSDGVHVQVGEYSLLMRSSLTLLPPQMDTLTVAEDLESNKTSPTLTTHGRGFHMMEDPIISAEFKRPPY